MAETSQDSFSDSFPDPVVRWLPPTSLSPNEKPAPRPTPDATCPAILPRARPSPLGAGAANTEAPRKKHRTAKRRVDIWLEAKGSPWLGVCLSILAFFSSSLSHTLNSSQFHFNLQIVLIRLSLSYLGSEESYRRILLVEGIFQVHRMSEGNGEGFDEKKLREMMDRISMATPITDHKFWSTQPVPAIDEQVRGHAL